MGRLFAPGQLVRLALKPTTRPLKVQLGSPYAQLDGRCLQGSARRGFRCDVSRRATPQTWSRTTAESSSRTHGLSAGKTGSEKRWYGGHTGGSGRKSEDEDNTGDNKNRKHASSSTPLTILAGGGVLSLVFAATQTHAENPAPIQAPVPSKSKDSRDPSLPRFRLADIRKHDGNSTNPWVTSGDKVYDITDWVAAHPGGDVILRAAGGSIDPYWAIFTIHKAPHVKEILEQYCIGYVDAADLVDGLPRSGEEVEDPFRDDPVRDPRMIFHTTRPANAEPPADELTDSWLTPKELFYVRHHMWVPKIDPDAADEHVLTIELPDGEEKKYTLAELKARFKTHAVTAALQCSGNRRSDMSRSVGKADGLPWAVGAISNATWEGVLLADVLADAGLKIGQSPSEAEDDPDDMHVQFTSMEAYGASIPLPTALARPASVLLAFGMNGSALPPDHGFPLRAIVPGHVAARSVKWLSKIVVSDEESTTQWQRRDYKCFGPNEGVARKEDWDDASAIQEMPVTSAVTRVRVAEECKGLDWVQGKHESKRAPPGVRDPKAWSAPKTDTTPIAVTGYAYSGGGKAIVRVDVSVDGGKTWDQAELLPDGEDGRGARARGGKTYSWKRWRYAGKLTDFAATEKGGKCAEIIVKATDEAYNTQPEHHSSVYNVRGNLATAWHRVKVCPSCGEKGVKVQGCGFKDEETSKGKKE